MRLQQRCDRMSRLEGTDVVRYFEHRLTCTRHQRVSKRLLTYLLTFSALVSAACTDMACSLVGLLLNLSEQLDY